MKLLLASGARLDAEDANGFTPLRAASSLGQDEAVRILRSHSTSTPMTKSESQEHVAAMATPATTADQVESQTTAQATKTETAIQAYNRGVALYHKGQFRAATDAFGQVFKTGELKMQSAYIRALCQKELGLSVEIPPELGDKAEDAGTVYVASNLACHIITKGHKAALTKQESTSEVTALIEGSLYTISISSLFGGFNNWAWRKEGSASISVPDPDANPNPTRTDRFVITLAEKAGVLPPEPIPESGLKTTWE
jgi:ankyrin repeat protein